MQASQQQQQLSLGSSSNNNNTTAAAVVDRLLDSSDLEKERGITITSKVTRLIYNKNNNNNTSTDEDGSIIINIADSMYTVADLHHLIL